MYDSFNEGNEVYYEILDAYEDSEQAHKVAEAIHSNVDKDANKLKVQLANGKDYPNPKYHYLPWTGWGNRYRFTKVVRFTLDEPRITVLGSDY